MINISPRSLIFLLLFHLSVHAFSAESTASRMPWLPELSDELHPVITPPTLDFQRTKWVLSNDGKHALSVCDANIILWDVALGRPITVFVGKPTEVRFSEFSPHLIYMLESDGWWALTDINTGNKYGMFRTLEVPDKNDTRVPEQFLEKIGKVNNTVLEFSDMDINSDGNRVLLAGIYPFVWNIKDGVPEGFLNIIGSPWLDAIHSGNFHSYSPKYSFMQGGERKYWNPRCTFTSDNCMIVTLPESGAYIFDNNGDFLKQIQTDEVITQLRGFQNFIIAERLFGGPMICRYDQNHFEPIYNRYFDRLDALLISELSDDGHFVGWKRGLKNYIFGHLLDNGTASWSKHKGVEYNPSRLYMSKNGRWFSHTDNSGSKIIVCDLKDEDGPVLDGYTSFRYLLKNATESYSGAFVADSIFVLGTAYGEAFVLQRSHGIVNENDSHKTILNHFGPVIGVKALGTDRFITTDSHGTVRIWDTKTLNPVMTMFYFLDTNDYILFTPDNYYKMSKGASDRIQYVKGLDCYSFRQFDLKYNRPDIILERLGADKDKVKILKAAWRKRIKRMGFDEQGLNEAQSHAPTLDITNRKEISGKDMSKTATLNIHASDSKVALRSLHILVNGVPIYGSNGKSIAPRTNTYNNSESIVLAEGENEITVYCLNVQGQESLRQQIVINNPTKPAHRDLYVAAVGVSSYNEAGRNLQYAASDAEMYVNTLYTDNIKFNSIRTKLIKDNEFSGKSLQELKHFFAQANRDDVVMLYYAGHGILDSKLNYYLGTSNTDFSNPAAEGIGFEDFQDILDLTPSLHRFCIIDACHSGDIDKDEAMAVNAIPIEEFGDLTFRSAGKRVLSTVNQEVARQYHSMFIDLSQRPGLTLVSSSSGDELSVESARYGGGLFTHMLLKALNGEGDYNKDGSITTLEMLEFVKKQVSLASSGLQNPQVKYHDADINIIVK